MARGLVSRVTTDCIIALTFRAHNSPNRDRSRLASGSVARRRRSITSAEEETVDFREVMAKASGGGGGLALAVSDRRPANPRDWKGRKGGKDRLISRRMTERARERERKRRGRLCHWFSAEMSGLTAFVRLRKPSRCRYITELEWGRSCRRDSSVEMHLRASTA